MIIASVRVSIISYQRKKLKEIIYREGDWLGKYDVFVKFVWVLLIKWMQIMTICIWTCVLLVGRLSKLKEIIFLQFYIQIDVFKLRIGVTRGTSYIRTCLTIPIAWGKHSRICGYVFTYSGIHEVSSSEHRMTRAQIIRN